MHKESLAIANKQLTELRKELSQIVNSQIPAMEQAMKDVKAPYVKGTEVK